VACLGEPARLLAVTLPPGLQSVFPKADNAIKTSERTFSYNCHAWGADDTNAWWEPVPALSAPFPPWVKVYWPPGLRHFDLSLANFVAAFETRGFERCADGTLEDGAEKIAFYGKEASVTHTARQLPSGSWTSKLGYDIDILHASTEELEDGYGRVVAYMRRPRQASNVKEVRMP